MQQHNGHKGFFTRLAIESGASNRGIARDHYYALLRIIMNDVSIGKKEKIVLPDFGTFSSKISAPQSLLNLRKKFPQVSKYSKASKIIKFKPCERLRQYIKERS